MDNDKSIKTLTRSKLRPFRYHPYKVKEDEDMANLVNSIKEEGVISPIIVRKVGKDNYEILSGHRRFKACQILDIKEIPVIVKDIQMPEAAIYVVDSNLQRENLLPSEKAFAYKLKYDALKHQGKISEDLTSYQLGTKYKTDSAVQIHLRHLLQQSHLEALEAQPRHTGQLSIPHSERKLQADRVDVLPWKRSPLFAHCWIVDWLFCHALSSLRASSPSQLFRSSSFLCFLFFRFGSCPSRIRSNRVFFRISRRLAPPQQNAR